MVSDDKNPEDLLNGHIDLMLKEAIEFGLDEIEAIKMVTLNPAVHYNLNSGLISPGKAADMVIIDDLKDFNVKDVFIGGNKVAAGGKPLFSINPKELKSTFKINLKNSNDFDILSDKKKEKVRVIKAIEGQLLTEETERTLKVVKGKLKPDIQKDILKISVVERYGSNRISNGFIHGFGLQNGAIASSIAHDSHNIIAIGTNSQDMADAVNKLIQNRGGLVVASKSNFYSLNLPIGGLMSLESAKEVSTKLKKLHSALEDRGCKLKSPFMTMSFMTLLVIPKLKISDMGLFDVEKFEFVDLVKKWK